MASLQIPVELTYQKNGTVPPVYVAGSFSNPPWQPIEMDVSKDEHGEHVFSKTIDATPGSEFQYKFRIGSGDWWICSENVEIVKDEQGNANNVLRVPSIDPKENDDKAQDSRVAQLRASSPARGGSQTPDMANTASEVADSAALLDRNTPEPETLDDKTADLVPGVSAGAAESGHDNSASLDAGEHDSKDPSHPISPMFSHEYVAFPSEEDYEEPPEDSGAPSDEVEEQGGSDSKPHEYAEDSDIDLNDPTLEKFPSDSASIMATIRRLSTSVGEDRTVPQGTAPSLVLDPSSPSSDDLPDTPASEGPQAGQANAARKKRTVSTSAGSARSLNSIAEDDDELPSNESGSSPNGDPATVVHHPAFLVEPSTATELQPGEGDNIINLPGGSVIRQGPLTKPDSQKKDVTSDDDEGIAMCNVARERPAEGSLDSADLIIPEPTGSAPLHPSHIVEPPFRSTTPPPEEDHFDSAENFNPRRLSINRAQAGSPDIVVTSAPDDSKADVPNNDNLQKGNVDRPTSRTSLNSLHEVRKSPNWLQAFFRFFLVDWIGSFLSRLWAGKSTA